MLWAARLAALSVCGSWLEERLESWEELRGFRPLVVFGFGVMYVWGLISGLDEHLVDEAALSRVTGLNGLSMGSSGMVTSMDWRPVNHD